ncbi:MAG: restriction endonuclease subunit S [Bacilli bacterium]|nr:restriction endonuclease subunit S [Bacilli bacterium]
MRLKDHIISAKTGLDAIKRAPIVEDDTGLKCIRIQDISQEKDFNDWGNTIVSDSDYKKSLLKKNDILIARTGATVGVSYIVKEDLESVFNNGTIRLRFKDSVNSQFIYYIFKTKDFLQYIQNISWVATQPNLRIESLLRFTIPNYTREKQDKIVLILEKYDELIDNNNKRISQLEEIAQSLYQEWFVKFRFPGYESVNFEKQNPRGWIVSSQEKEMRKPNSWNYGELRKIAQFKRGKNITASEMIEGEVPVISAGLKPSGFHNEANVFGYSLTVSSSGANAGFLTYHLNDVWAADCSYYQNEKNIWFVYNTLSFLQEAITNMQVGSAQPHVYAKTINKLSIIIPPKELIYLYCEKVNSIYERIRVLKHTNNILSKQRDSLLPRLMSGKLNIEGKEII